MYDPALTPLLERCSNEELAPLVRFLTEPVTSTLKRSEAYRRKHPDHRQYIDEIAKEIRLFAGHSVTHRVTTPGGHVGQDYQRALGEALKELGVPSEAMPQGLLEREDLLVRRCIDSGFASRSEREQEELLQEFYRGDWYEEGKIAKRRKIHRYLQREAGGRHRLSLRKVGQVTRQNLKGFFTGKIRGALIKRGMKYVLKRAAGPIGWGIDAWGWLGPAWRVFIPVACYLAYLRRLKGMDRERDEAVINLVREDDE